MLLVAAQQQGHPSEKDAVSAQKLGQLQPFLAVFPQECVGQLASVGAASGPIAHSLREAGGGAGENGTAAAGDSCAKIRNWLAAATARCRSCTASAPACVAIDPKNAGCDHA